MSVTSACLKRGLLALGEAYRQKPDASTESLWAKVLSPLNDAQFNYAVGLQLRTVDRYFPPPGVVLAFGYDMPREDDDRPLPRVALPEWDVDVEQQGRVLCSVRDNPISETERTGGLDGALHYLRRVAIAAELIDVDGNAVKAMPNGVTEREA